jgi:putative sigma-54 modulation protein
MRFEYTGRHIEVTPALRAHVEEQFKKLDHIFNGAPARAHVILDVEKDRHIGEIVVNWRDHAFTVKETNRDMYLALTKAVGKLEKQTLKLKQKNTDRKRHATPRAALAPVPDGEIEPAPAAPRVISARSYEVKPQTPDEAASQLAQEANQFLVFRDAKTNRVNVIYKRKDGNYGLIDP